MFHQTLSDIAYVSVCLESIFIWKYFEFVEPDRYIRYLHLIYTIDLGAFLIPVLKYLAAVKLKAYLLDCVCSNAKC